MPSSDYRARHERLSPADDIVNQLPVGRRQHHQLADVDEDASGDWYGAIKRMKTVHIVKSPNGQHCYSPTNHQVPNSDEIDFYISN